jgi:thymidine kinase
MDCAKKRFFALLFPSLLLSDNGESKLTVYKIVEGQPANIAGDFREIQPAIDSWESVQAMMSAAPHSRFLIRATTSLTPDLAAKLWRFSEAHDIDLHVAIACNHAANDNPAADLLLAYADEISPEAVEDFLWHPGLYFFHGCMGSGKSAYALALYRRLLSSSGATAFSFEKGFMFSRNGDTASAIDFTGKTSGAPELDFRAWYWETGCNVLIIDEAQFLSHAQIGQLQYLADDYGCCVYCFGIRTAFDGGPLVNAGRLLRAARAIYEVRSGADADASMTETADTDASGRRCPVAISCEPGFELIAGLQCEACGTGPAQYHQRLSTDTSKVNTDITIYRSICSACWLKQNSEFGA